MKIHRLSFAAALFASAAVGALAQSQAPKVTWHWPDSVEAVRAAPKNHTVLFENGHIRLLEVTIRAGEKENFHGHQYPSVFAFDAVQPRGQDTLMDTGVTRDIGRMYENAELPACLTMGVQAPHAFHVVDSFQQHFYRLEFKKVDGKDIFKQP